MTKSGSIVGAFAPLLIFVAMTAVSTGTASAASPEKCIIYARDYARAVAVPTSTALVPARPLQDIQDAAYARCRNSARVPRIPTTVDRGGASASAAPRANRPFFPSFDEVFGVSKHRPAPPKRVVSRSTVRTLTTPVSAYAAGGPAPVRSRSASAIVNTFGSGSVTATSAPALGPAMAAPTMCAPRLLHFWRGTMSVGRAGSC